VEGLVVMGPLVDCRPVEPPLKRPPRITGDDDVSFHSMTFPQAKRPKEFLSAGGP
jgi:hypothetical protein